jgi:hypothetical protein
MSEIVVERAGDGWRVAGAGRVSLRQIRQMAKDSGQPICWPESFRELTAAVEVADAKVAAANRESVRARLVLVNVLLDEGVSSLSEIGAVLGVSRQRVHSLLKAHRRGDQ